MLDRRTRPHAPRYEVQLPVSYRPEPPAMAATGIGWTRDLSEGGACLELPVTLAPGTALALILQTYRGAIPTQAEVIWAGSPDAEGPTRHGVGFTRIRPEPQAALRAILQTRHAEPGALLRRPLAVPVLCDRKGHSPRPLEGRTGDVGRQGILIHLPEPLPVGTEVVLTLEGLAGHCVQVGGRIAWGEPLPAGPSPAAIPHGVQLGAPPPYAWEALCDLVAGWPPEGPPAASKCPGGG